MRVLGWVGRRDESGEASSHVGGGSPEGLQVTPSNSNAPPHLTGPCDMQTAQPRVVCSDAAAGRPARSRTLCRRRLCRAAAAGRGAGGAHPRPDGTRPRPVCWKGDGAHGRAEKGTAARWAGCRAWDGANFPRGWAEWCTCASRGEMLAARCASLTARFSWAVDDAHFGAVGRRCPSLRFLVPTCLHAWGAPSRWPHGWHVPRHAQCC